MKNTKETIQRHRAAHHAALESLAKQVGCNKPGLTLWRELRRLESKLHRACEAYSSYSDYGLERWEADKDAGYKELSRIFGGTIPKGVFINSDPRGHSLKLDSEQVTIPEGMSKDWGQYGILAAEID